VYGGGGSERPQVSIPKEPYKLLVSNKPRRVLEKKRGKGLKGRAVRKTFSKRQIRYNRQLSGKSAIMDGGQAYTKGSVRFESNPVVRVIRYSAEGKQLARRKIYGQTDSTSQKVRQITYLRGEWSPGAQCSWP